MELKVIWEKFKKFLPYIAMVVFCIITIKKGFFSGRMCWEDEAHAWTIAAHTNIIQLIELMKVEGHFLLWFLCLMPFAKFNIAYPYPMLILNWLFCVLALCVMWWKAPFNKILKLFITFSAPFLSLYSIHARCYSIGILFLFLALAFYKERLVHPYRYLLILVLAANTNFLVFLAAAILGIMFVYDLIKNKCDKNILYAIFSVVLLHLILFYFQFCGGKDPDYDISLQLIKAPYILKLFFGLIKIKFNLFMLKIIFLRVAVIAFLILLYKNKRAFSLFVYASLILVLFFSLYYTARVHHLGFLYIFAISAFWLYKEEGTNDKYHLIEIILTLLSLQLMLAYILPPRGWVKLSEEVLADKKLSAGKVYSNIEPITLSVNLPYLENKNVYLYDLSGRNLSKFEGLKCIFDKDAKIFYPDKLALSLDKDRDNYLISNVEFDKHSFKGEKYRIHFKFYKKMHYRNLQYLYVYKFKSIEKL